MNLSTPHISVQPPRSVCLLSMVGMAWHWQFKPFLLLNNAVQNKVLVFTTCAVLALKMHLEGKRERKKRTVNSIGQSSCMFCNRE